MSERSYYFVLNPRSGTAQSLGLTPETLGERLKQAGYDARIDPDDDAPFEQRIERARASDCDVIVAAGGDGTASGIASALLDSDKILAVLPLGTVNSLAKDLEVPLDLDGWIAGLDAMQPRRIDVGEVNGRIFMHMVVIGLIPGMAAGRELLRDRNDLTAKIGLLRYFFRRLLRARRLAVQIDPGDDEARVERVQAIAVTCNAYEEGFGRILKRQQLDSGQLTLYVLKRLGVIEVVRLGFEMLMGRWQQDEAVTIQSVPAVTIRSHKRRLQVMLDGEIESFEVPLSFRVRQGALQVLAAPVVESSATGEDKAAPEG